MNVYRTLLPEKQAVRLAEQYRRALFDDFVPWWERHSIDHECGGFFSCLERDGRVYAGDKFTWMISRQVWMFSQLYNRYEQRPEWLKIARHGASFLSDHAWGDDGQMHYRLTREGRPLASCEKLNTACFAAIGLAELSNATGDESLWQKAVQTYERVRPQLGQPTNTPLLGYPLDEQFHLHAHDMIRLTVAWVLNELRPEARWEADLTASAESVIGRHWKPELDALLENAAPDGSTMFDRPEGRLIHPGHAMETAWMLMEVARRRGDSPLMEAAVAITLSSLARGWDDEFGGVRYLVNVDQSPTYPAHADMKLWWVHAEAIYAALLGYVCTGNEQLGRWYERLHDYSFNHFCDAEHGEWYGTLNRDGTVVHTAKADGRKGFFHIPRFLFRSYQLLRA